MGTVAVCVADAVDAWETVTCRSTSAFSSPMHIDAFERVTLKKEMYRDLIPKRATHRLCEEEEEESNSIILQK